MRSAAARIVGLSLLLVGFSAASNATESAAQPAIDEEVGRFYFPNASANPNANGTITIKAYEHLVRNKVVWAKSAQVTKAVQIDTEKGMQWIETDEVLPAIRVSNLPGESGDVIAYCTVAKTFRPDTSQQVFGLLGAKLAKSLSDSRKCIYDKDRDGAADTLFYVDDGKEPGRRPQPIRPVALTIVENREIGLGDLVFITLSKASTPSFSIGIHEAGKFLRFETVALQGATEPQKQKLGKDISYPFDMSIYGAHFTILSHDPKSGAMTIRWSDDHRDARIPVQSEAKYHYIYQ